MTTVSLPANSITRSQYAATLGQPMHRTTVLLRQDCPSCGGQLRQTGFSDWVRQHGIIVTLWSCVAAPYACEASRLDTSFRLETAVVDDPAPEPVERPELSGAASVPGWMTMQRTNGENTLLSGEYRWQPRGALKCGADL